MQRLALCTVFAGRNADLDGFAEGQRQLLLLRFVRLVGSYNALHQHVAHHVAILEVAEVNALDAAENVDRVEQAGLARVGR